jgi:hypothetical protein
MKEIDMKKTDSNINSEEMAEEYTFDYSKAKKNPYFSKKKMFIEIDEDVFNSFESSEKITDVLKTIASSRPGKHIL